MPSELVKKAHSSGGAHEILSRPNHPQACLSSAEMQQLFLHTAAVTSEGWGAPGDHRAICADGRESAGGGFERLDAQQVPLDAAAIPAVASLMGFVQERNSRMDL